MLSRCFVLSFHYEFIILRLGDFVSVCEVIAFSLSTDWPTVMTGLQSHFVWVIFTVGFLDCISFPLVPLLGAKSARMGFDPIRPCVRCPGLSAWRDSLRLGHTDGWNVKIWLPRSCVNLYVIYICLRRCDDMIWWFSVLRWALFQVINGFLEGRCFKWFTIVND